MAKTEKPTVKKYIDPLTDFGFKRLFGSEPNKDLLIDFLNGVFRGRKHIADLVYNKNEHPGETVNEGGAIFDLTCTGNDGEQFIIEVQRGKQGNFKQRAIFYTSRLVTEQAPKGKRSEWAYNVKEVYLIALLEDFSLDNIESDGGFLHDICLSNRETGKVFYEGLGYIFIELIKFVKTEAELDTDLDKWLYVLKNMSSMNKIPVYLRKPIFEKLFNIAEYSNLTKEEKTMYDTSLKRKWDNKAVLDYAVNEAAKEAAKEAKQEEKMEIAREMKMDGISVEQIAKFTKLSIEKIEKL
ncbi:Rpn family recombination-promoting nuclease/putative transposase [Parapedobacter soli]|uniref:Rpn family recombination-promoting nuclease/putative transposase n=1 Tax=Parapedobacter soli TaxID=416955 RepID=UPI0021C988C4|nr:Rpn family recombination-promoting nuclease/putative transposase [Parapedobacter soli]